MKQLQTKLKKQGGFTLIEMLLVVAIIAILVAVSIPVVGNSLGKARIAADQANERAAKSVTLMYFMGAIDDPIPGNGPYDDPYEAGMGMAKDASFPVYYDAENGILTYDKPEGYGQCNKNDTDDGIPHTGNVIQVTITDKGVFEPYWVPGAEHYDNPEDDPNYDPWAGL